jgi:protein-disulfide isomerase
VTATSLRRVIDGATVIGVIAIVAVLTTGWVRRAIGAHREAVPPAADGAVALRRLASDSSAPLPSGRRLSRLELRDLARSGELVGDSSAPIRIIVYGDYSCGWCAAYDSTLADVRRQFPDHVAVSYKPLLLDSTAAGVIDTHAAARCAADQGAFLRFHLAAFAHQGIVGQREGWREIARAASIPDLAALERCVLSDRYREAVLASTREAHRFGFASTPASIVGRQPAIGNLAPAVLDSLIGARLAELRLAYH